MDSIEGRVLGYLIIKHPTMIRANTTEMRVMPHLIVQEGIAPHYFLDWFTIEGFSFNELFHVLINYCIGSPDSTGDFMSVDEGNFSLYQAQMPNTK